MQYRASPPEDARIASVWTVRPAGAGRGAPIAPTITSAQGYVLFTAIPGSTTASGSAARQEVLGGEPLSVSW